VVRRSLRLGVCIGGRAGEGGPHEQRQVGPVVAHRRHVVPAELQRREAGAEVGVDVGKK